MLQATDNSLNGVRLGTEVQWFILSDCNVTKLDITLTETTSTGKLNKMHLKD